MNNFSQPAESYEFTAPAGGVVSGTGVKIGDLLVIAEVTVAAGVRFNGLRIGCVEHAKLSAQAWAEGQQVNWDDTAKRFTTVTTGNFRAGVAGRVAANPSATGFVILHGGNLGTALA
jgi:predicted RecA/RadA family phage recombinase